MKKNSVSIKQLRSFGFLIGFGFPIFIGFILPTIGGHLYKMWTLWIGLIAFLLGLLKPSLLFYPYKVWMLIGHILGWLNSRIILGLVFFIILQPISFIMRMFGYDPLKRKKSNAKSYREKNENHKIDLTRIF